MFYILPVAFLTFCVLHCLPPFLLPVLRFSRLLSILPALPSAIFTGCSPVQPGTPLCLCSSSACSHPYYVLCSLSAAILVLSTTVLTACSPVLPAAIFTSFFPVLPCFLLKSCFFVDFKCFHVTD
jgi:hypothetical protein